MGIISQKLRNSAKGELCTLNVVGYCLGGTETTVLCHAPSAMKGMGSKSPDFWAAFGCAGCHEALDMRRVDIRDEQYYWLRGILRTWQRWIDGGLVMIPVDPATAKTRPRKKSNIKSAPMPGTKASGVRKRFDGIVERHPPKRLYQEKT